MTPPIVVTVPPAPATAYRTIIEGVVSRPRRTRRIRWVCEPMQHKSTRTQTTEMSAKHLAHERRPDHVQSGRTQHESNRRQRQLGRTAKLLWSTVLRLRADWPEAQASGMTANAFALREQARLAAEGLNVSHYTIRDATLRMSWQVMQ